MAPQTRRLNYNPSHKEGREGRIGFNIGLTDVALRLLYPLFWPGYQVIPIALSGASDLEQRLDVSGVDKLLIGRDGHSIIVSDRFREHGILHKYPEFTIRESEWRRHTHALSVNGAVPGVFLYGYATPAKDDFAKVYVVRYAKWLQDVLAKRARAPKFRDRNGEAENFYYIPWAEIPRDYLFARRTGPFGAPT